MWPDLLNLDGTALNEPILRFEFILLMCVNGFIDVLLGYWECDILNQWINEYCKVSVEQTTFFLSIWNYGQSLIYPSNAVCL